MNKKDYYDILGVSKTATDAEIKSAFRKLAKKYHPDVNKEPGADAKFKEAQESYAILSDGSKRSKYDQYGHAAFENNQGGGAGGSEGFNGADFDFGDIFGDLFGGGFGGGRQASANQRHKGNDMELNLTITFDEAVFGCEKAVKVTLEEECTSCLGAGGHKPSACPTCHGSGAVTKEQRSMFGTYLAKSVCPTCNGKGKTYKETCNVCHGQGRVKNNKEIKVTVPSGISDGNTLRVSGKGGAGYNGGPAGDLFINFRVTPHKIFVRENDDIYLEAPITISEAVLGTKLELPTLYGKVTLTVPSGSQPNDKHRLKGKGVSNVHNSHKGNMFVILKVQVPNKVTREQKKLFEELSKTNNKKDIFYKFKKYMN